MSIVGSGLLKSTKREGGFFLKLNFAAHGLSPIKIRQFGDKSVHRLPRLHRLPGADCEMIQIKHVHSSSSCNQAINLKFDWQRVKSVRGYGA